MTDVSLESEPNDSPMTRIYVLVVLVEAVVITALWSFTRYFG